MSKKKEEMGNVPLKLILIIQKLELKGEYCASLKRNG